MSPLFWSLIGVGVSVTVLLIIVGWWAVSMLGRQADGEFELEDEEDE